VQRTVIHVTAVAEIVCIGFASNGRLSRALNIYHNVSEENVNPGQRTKRGDQSALLAKYNMNDNKQHSIRSEASVKKILILLFLGFLFPVSFLTAQEFTGRVTDASGAVLSKAKVTAHNLDTDVDTATVSTGAGGYTIPYLKPGNYSVTADVNGFQRELRTGIVLQVGQTATVNFALKVGQVSETVTVKGAALLDFSKADVGEVVENTRVTELPLNGRDPGMLSILSAGTGWTGSIQYQRPFDDTQANLTVNGGGSGNTELLLDGVVNTASSINETGSARIAYVPPVDSVQEFKIITNPYDAEFGLMAGGVEDVTLKSGTNQLHGDVYEYARRTFLDANTWQNDWAIANATPGSEVSQFKTLQHKLDQYGVEVDGPVFIPKLYDGRSKTFFTMQYENWSEVTPNTTTTSVPDPSWAKGDFTNLTYWTGSSYAPISLLDPQNISQNGQGVYVRVPFGPTDTINPTTAANIIPASRINPVAQKIVSLYPAPNTTTAEGTNPFANNYTLATPATNHYRNVLGKLDELLSAKDRVSLHYGYWERLEVRNGNGLSGPVESGLLPHVQRSNNFTLEETHTFSPNLLFDFRANVTVRDDAIIDGPAFDPTTLGYSPEQVAQWGPAAKNEFPYITVSEFATLGTNNNTQTTSNSLTLFPTATWIKGKHTIHAGLDARFMQSINSLVNGGNNLFVDRTWTQTKCGSCGSWDPASGNSIASLLLGNLTSGEDNINTQTFWSGHYWAPFVQDDWKVTKRLVLNLGVRWDLLPAEVERHNRTNYAFDTTAVNPISSQVNVPGHGQLLGGVTYAGIDGNPRGGYALTKNSIQPRFGFAYALDDKTVFKGGFGESMRNPQNNLPSFGYSATTSYQGADPTHPGSTYPNAATTIDHPYESVVQPSGSSMGMLEQLGQGPWFVNPHYKIPSFWNYAVGIQHQFLQHDVLNINYVGTRLYNGDSSDNINHEDAAAFAPCNPQLGGRPEVCDNNTPVNPFLGINGFQGSGYYNSTTINALNYTRAFPQFGDITEWQLNASRTWYNSLQVTGLHQWNNSFTVHGSWTWSKLMDAGGYTDQTYRVQSRSIDPNDRTHRITLSGVYLLPVGRGRTFLSNANRIVDGVIGGWELSSLYIYQTGTPWGIPGSTTYLQNAYVHPHIQQNNGFIRLAAACAEQYKENNAGVYQLVQLPFDYDGTCSQGPNFQQVPSYGETPNTVYSGIRLPRMHQFDSSLAKNFQIVERLRLQIRMDAFNVLNHPLWSESPDGNTNDSTFGLIERGPSGQSNLPRQIQLSAKLVW
jgi:hypothetical protein